MGNHSPSEHLKGMGRDWKGRNMKKLRMIVVIVIVYSG